MQRRHERPPQQVHCAPGQRVSFLSLLGSVLSFASLSILIYLPVLPVPPRPQRRHERLPQYVHRQPTL